MKAWILLGTLILLLAGCVSATSVQYVKAGATDLDFEDDKAECTQQMLKSSIEANLPTTENPGVSENNSTTPTPNPSVRQMVKQCLQTKGWALEPVQK